LEILAGFMNNNISRYLKEESEESEKKVARGDGEGNFKKEGRK